MTQGDGRTLEISLVKCWAKAVATPQFQADHITPGSQVCTLATAAERSLQSLFQAVFRESLLTPYALPYREHGQGSETLPNHGDLYFNPRLPCSKSRETCAVTPLPAVMTSQLSR